jgi:hypothetical protein
MSKQNMIVLGIVIAVVCLLVGVPLVSIWAVNTLFAANITYSVLNWFAAFILLVILNGGRSK